MLKQKKYYPQLDAIRGVSFLAVFLYHTVKPNFGDTFISKLVSFFLNNLFFSIDVFFVLSSFLITLLGIKEYNKNGNFSFKNYFFRRALRIWPLYYLFMFFVFVVLKQLQHHFHLQLTLPPAQWYLLFVSNYYSIGHVFFLQILWTLSVEEQFYLIWGFCLTYFQKKLKWVILIIALISVIFNFLSSYCNKPIYNNTISYLIDMMIGAYAAYCLNKNNNVIVIISKYSKRFQWLIYSFIPLLFFVYFLVNDYILGGGQHRVLEEIVRQLFILIFGIIIIHQMLFESSFFSLSKNKFLIYTGKISFGLYCFHGIVIAICSILINYLQIKLNVILVVLFELLLTFFISTISYYYYEKPFLKIKNKLRRT